MRKLQEINIIHLTEFYFIIKISCNVDNGNSGSLVVAAAAWQRWRQWRQRGVSGSGGSLGVTWQWRQQCDYKNDNEAELMEENYGNKEEYDDTLGS